MSVDSFNFVQCFINLNRDNILKYCDLEKLKWGEGLDVYLFDRNCLDLMSPRISKNKDLNRLKCTLTKISDDITTLKCKNHFLKTENVINLNIRGRKNGKLCWIRPVNKPGLQAFAGWRGPIIKLENCKVKPHTIVKICSKTYL